MKQMKKTLLPPRHAFAQALSYLLLLSPLFAAGCASAPSSLQEAIAQKNVKTSDEYRIWNPLTLSAQNLTLAAARTSPETPARIYIEGDGRAFITKDTPSGNPTPVTPVALHLALKDSTTSILYLARPCQWTRGPECIGKLPENAIWTQGRFTQQIADAYTQIIAEQTRGQPVELIGYSGGAWVALQVAARLPNVTQVSTIAGNLLPSWLNEQHHVASIPVAPYPTENRLENLPTYLYMAATDPVIRPGIVEAYQQATGAQLLHPITVPNTTHTKGWDAFTLPPTYVAEPKSR